VPGALRVLQTWSVECSAGGRWGHLPWPQHCAGHLLLACQNKSRLQAVLARVPARAAASKASRPDSLLRIRNIYHLLAVIAHLLHAGPVLEVAAVKVGGGELPDGGVHAVLQAGTGDKGGGENTTASRSHHITEHNLQAFFPSVHPMQGTPRFSKSACSGALGAPYLRVQHVHRVPSRLQPLEHRLAVALC